MPLPELPEKNKILKISNSYNFQDINGSVINFQKPNCENVKVRVILDPKTYNLVVQYFDDSNSWNAFRDDDERKVLLEDVIAQNKERDSAYATELQDAIGEELSNFDLAIFFQRAFREGYTKASEVIFNKFIDQTKDNFDATALRKFYSVVKDIELVQIPGSPLVDLVQMEKLKDSVIKHVKNRNSQHRKNIVTSSVPIDAIRMSLETSLGPRRYQAILGILRDDCDISLGDLDQYVGNAEEFKSIQFDHADYHKDDPENTFVQFNQKAVELLNQDGGKLWKDLDKLLRSKAYKKDLKRIVEKLNPSDELKNEIDRHLLAIYSGEAIEGPFNQLKIILISQRLKAKGLEQDNALSLATRFVVGKESLETLQQDESVQKMGKTKPSERKLEAIFTKYAAFGKISDATQLRKRVVGKVLSQFQKKFAEQIHYLDGIQTVEMDGSEILFRGIDEKSGLTEDLIKQQFEDIHVGMSTSDGVSQQLSSYKIQQKRVVGPGGLGNRASYATATTFNFAVAAKYAGNEGWIYDVRPKKGKVATNLQKLSPTYQEIDFEAIDPEEIYAVYKVSQTSSYSGNSTINRAHKIEKVILNPHYKKREGDSLNLLVEEQEIVTEEFQSTCDGGGFSVTSDDDDDPFKKFNERQIAAHESKYLSGSHLREATSILMQNKEVKPLVVGLDYNRSFSDIDAGSEVVEKDAAVTDQSDAALQEKSDDLWVNYKKGSNMNVWFWGNLGNSGDENNFKVFISVEPDDLNKATEILIKNGYFNYQQLPKCCQKVPSYSEENIKVRLAIILYAQGDKTEESDKIWAERLNAIEKDFYEAGIKPRPLVSKEKAASVSVADDRKFPGSLYSYYKKDVFKYDQPWNWQDDNYFSGIEINVAESINQKIWAIKSKISEAEAGGNSSELPRLNDMLRAEELYLEISKVGPEGTEYIQSGKNIPDGEKTIEVKVISFDSSEETQTMTLERARYFHANDLRRCGSIETGNVDILTAPDDDITISTQTSPAITHEEALEQTLDQFKSGDTEEKIFEAVNSSSNVVIEKLSAKDVAIRKATAVKGSEDLTKKNLAGLLEYAAKGVLNKAIKAKNCSGSRNVNQENWDQDGGSEKAWYKRFTRTNFKKVDLSKTFRTVFVNCTFDENCILPNDSSSIDPKYFLNCEFSKVLMDKPENEALKSALENAGMELDRDDGFYKIGNVERKRYADKTKEGKPNPNFKPIESFKFVEGIEIWLKEIDR